MVSRYPGVTVCQSAWFRLVRLADISDGDEAGVTHGRRQRKNACRARRPYPGRLADATQQVVVERDDSRSVGVPAGGRRNTHREDVVGPESRIHSKEADERPHHQPRSGQEDHGHGHLRRDEEPLHPA